MLRSLRLMHPLVALHAAPALRRAPSQLRACTSGANRAATGGANTTTSLISDVEDELKRASKAMLGTMAPSLRDAIDVEAESKAMLGKLYAADAILKLKNPDDITEHTVSMTLTLTRTRTRTRTQTLTLTV